MKIVQFDNKFLFVMRKYRKQGPVCQDNLETILSTDDGAQGRCLYDMIFVYYGLESRIFAEVGGLQLIGRKSREKLSTLF